MLELESGNVGATNDFIICVHIARSAVGLRVLDLVEVDCSVSLGDLEAESEDLGKPQRRGRMGLTSISRKFSGGP